MINNICSKPKCHLIHDPFTPKPNKDPRPKTQIQCPCQFCITYQSKQFTKTLNLRQLHQSKKLSNILSQPMLKTNLQYILQKLVVPANKIVTSSLNIYIPEICYFKQGNLKSLYLNKDINDTLIKKTIGDKINMNIVSKLLNERRWYYRMAILNKKSTHAKVDSKQCIIVQFMDGYEKLLSELEFLEIVQKRKQDPFWKTIYSLRNFISLPKQKAGRTIIKYKCNKNINEQLFQRAQTVTLINARNIIEDQNDQSQLYINSDSQETFCWMMIQSGEMEYLFTYLTYKVIKFISKFHDTEIQKGEFTWIIDQLKRPVLIDVQKLSMKDLIKYDWTQKIIQERKQQEHHNLFYKQNIHPANQKDRYECSIIQKQISDEYSMMKNHFQLKTNNDQHLNFIVKPKIKSETQIFRSNNKRKPLFREFNSNIIRLSHSLTPNIKKRKVMSFDSYVPVKEYRRKSVQSKLRHLSTNISQEIEFKERANRSVLLKRLQK